MKNKEYKVIGLLVENSDGSISQLDKSVYEAQIEQTLEDGFDAGWKSRDDGYHTYEEDLEQLKSKYLTEDNE